MNAFEDIVRRYLEAQGYWVRQSVKVEITKEEKRAIGTYSMPRPEIDLVAFDAKKNELILIEAKSYLDSYGVYYEAVTDPKDEAAPRYKLLTNEVFQKIVTSKIEEDYRNRGLIKGKIKINYGLATGNIKKGNVVYLEEYFNKQGWLLITPNQLKGFLNQCAVKGWEDDLVTMTAKILIKNLQ